jgi:hypothetical protein
MTTAVTDLSTQKKVSVLGVKGVKGREGEGRNEDGWMVRGAGRFFVFFVTDARNLLCQKTHRFAHCSENLRIISTVFWSTGFPVWEWRGG